MEIWGLYHSGQDMASSLCNKFVSGRLLHARSTSCQKGFQIFIAMFFDHSDPNMYNLSVEPEHWKQLGIWGIWVLNESLNPGYLLSFDKKFNVHHFKATMKFHIGHLFSTNFIRLIVPDKRIHFVIELGNTLSAGRRDGTEHMIEATHNKSF